MKKLSEETKTKLIYSGELIIFSIVFILFGIFKMTGIMAYKEGRRIVFNWITVFGSSILMGDFIWAILSKKRRERISLVDKCLALPAGLFIFIFDLISLISKPENKNFYIYSIGLIFIYLGIDYLFQGIYHYFKPVPMLFEDDEKPNKSDDKIEEIPTK